ncbi:MAG: protein kinase [Desulfobacterales bacterium]|nr:protein kinase [Desulfobacterales bacterium]
MPDKPIGQSNNTASDIESLAEEFLQLLHDGKNPSVQDYVRNHPDLAEEIEELFPTIQAVEGIKASSEQQLVTVPKQVEQLGGYRIIREIGRGGMGVVYEAQHIRLDRRAAVKVLPPHLGISNQQSRDRFLSEGRTAAALQHHSIAPVYDAGQQDGLHYYVMHYIHGASLEQIMRFLILNGPPDWFKDADETKIFPRLAQMLADPDSSLRIQVAEATQIEIDEIDRKQLCRKLPPAYYRAVAELIRQVALALEYAHKEGVLHRDIKPGNLMVEADGGVWITDFGLAKALRPEDKKATTTMVGTPRYIAPEQFEGRGDHRSDIYGLSLVLYELLTMQSAFHFTPDTPLIRRILHGNLTPPRMLNPHVPLVFETIIQKGAALMPDKRFATAVDMANALERWLNNQPLPPELKYSPQSMKTKASWWTKAKIWVAVLLLTFAALLFKLSGENRQPITSPTDPTIGPVADPVSDQIAANRKHAEELARLKAVAQAQLEAEIQALQEAEAQSIQDAEEQEKREAELQARLKNALEDKEAAEAEAQALRDKEAQQVEQNIQFPPQPPPGKPAPKEGYHPFPPPPPSGMAGNAHRLPETIRPPESQQRSGDRPPPR